MILSVRASAIALLLLTSTSAMSNQKAAAWTDADRGIAVDAAVAIATGPDNAGRVSMLHRLTDELIKAKDTARARTVARMAASRLSNQPEPNSLSSSFDRGRVIQQLAFLGDVKAAKQLLAADVTPAGKVTLLSRFGIGSARAQNFSEVQSVLAEIRSLSANQPTDVVQRATVVALSDIGIALADAGVVDQAVQIATELPQGLLKVRVLSRAAGNLCQQGTAEARNLRTAEQFLQRLAAEIRPAMDAADKPYEKSDVVVAIGEAFAMCRQPDKAKSLADTAIEGSSKNRSLGFLMDNLLRQDKADLARQLLLIADSQSAEVSLDMARRWSKVGDRVKAIGVANEVARKAHERILNVTLSRAQFYEFIAQVGQTVTFLIEMDSYEDALALTDIIDEKNRSQYYVSALGRAARQSDTKTVERLFPAVIEAVKKEPLPGIFRFRKLYDLTEMLVRAGFRNEARRVFAEIKAMSVNSTALESLPQQQVVMLAAVLQADEGDVTGALALAQEAGPMTSKPDNATLMYLAAIRLQGLNQPPTPAQAEEALAQAKAAMPLAAGPQANVLSAVARHLAAKGDITSALRAGNALAEEKSDVITGMHDGAMSAIAAAQLKAGDLRGSLATVLRIRQWTVRNDPLLKLVAVPAR